MRWPHQVAPPVGKNAPEHLRGQSVTIQTEVHRVTKEELEK
jgi:hypothetical protein